MHALEKLIELHNGDRVTGAVPCRCRYCKGVDGYTYSQGVAAILRSVLA